MEKFLEIHNTVQVFVCVVSLICYCFMAVLLFRILILDNKQTNSQTMLTFQQKVTVTLGSRSTVRRFLNVVTASGRCSRESRIEMTFLKKKLSESVTKREMAFVFNTKKRIGNESLIRS